MVQAQILAQMEQAPTQQRQSVFRIISVPFVIPLESRLGFTKLVGFHVQESNFGIVTVTVVSNMGKNVSLDP